MASKSQGEETFAQGLGKILGDLGSLMATPGADMGFVQGLQMVVAQKVQELIHMGPQGQGGQQAPTGQGMGSPLPGMGGPAGATLAGPPNATNGISAMPQAPNPDELRRMVGAGAGQ